MPINAHPEYIAAEKHFHEAQTDEERLVALEEMVKTAPSHKGGETLRVNLKSRYKKLKEKLEKEKTKVRARGKQRQGIKKAEIQAALIGFTNSGKSSIFKTLTNYDAKIASYGFTTKDLTQAILNYEGCKIQMIDTPPIGSEYFDSSIINTTDTLLLVVEKVNEIEELKKFAQKSPAKQIIIFNKIDMYDLNTRRKIQDNLKSKRYPFVLFSSLTQEGIEELKSKIFNSFNKIRVYTKQPSSSKPDENAMVMEPGSTIQDAARKALHGKSLLVKQAKIWGPSSKFSGQLIGIKHILKDKDIVEFITK